MENIIIWHKEFFFRNKSTIEKLLKFVVVGGSAFVIDAGGYYILTRFINIPFLPSRIISVSCSLLVNFLFNKYWTFKPTTGRATKQLLRFLLVMTITSFLNVFLMRIGVHNLGFPDMAVLVTVSILIASINFIAHGSWSYNDQIN